MDSATLSSLAQLLSGQTASNLRTAAVAAIAASTAGEANHATRVAVASTPLLLRRLLSLRGDPAAGRLAVSSLINIAEEPSAALALIKLRAVGISTSALLDQAQHGFASLYTALLSNLTRYPEGVNALVGEDTDFDENERRVAEATLLALSAKLKAIPNVLFFANACSNERGRHLLIGSADDKSHTKPLNAILELLHDEDKDRRLAAALALRNCALAETSHSALVGRTDVIGVVLTRFLSPTHPLSEDDIQIVPQEVRNATANPLNWKAEPYAEIRLMLVEALLLFCKTKEGRDALRNHGAYPVLRNWHLEEEDEGVKDAIEQIVDRTQLLQEDATVNDENASTNIRVEESDEKHADGAN